MDDTLFNPIQMYYLVQLQRRWSPRGGVIWHYCHYCKPTQHCNWLYHHLRNCFQRCHLLKNGHNACVQIYFPCQCFSKDVLTNFSNQHLCLRLRENSVIGHLAKSLFFQIWKIIWFLMPSFLSQQSYKQQATSKINNNNK